MRKMWGLEWIECDVNDEFEMSELSIDGFIVV